MAVAGQVTINCVMSLFFFPFQKLQKKPHSSIDQITLLFNVKLHANYFLELQRTAGGCVGSKKSISTMYYGKAKMLAEEV